MSFRLVSSRAYNKCFLIGAAISADSPPPNRLCAIRHNAVALGDKTRCLNWNSNRRIHTHCTKTGREPEWELSLQRLVESNSGSGEGRVGSLCHIFRGTENQRPRVCRIVSRHRNLRAVYMNEGGLVAQTSCWLVADISFIFWPIPRSR